MEFEDIFLAKKPVSSATIVGSTIVHNENYSPDNSGSNVVTDLPATNKDEKTMNKTLKTSLIVGAFLIPIIVGVIYFKRKTK